MEDLDDAGLSRESTADNHQTVTHHDSFVQLDALLQEFVFGLEFKLLAGHSHVIIKQGVIGNGSDDTREQIRGDTIV